MRTGTSSRAGQQPLVVEQQFGVLLQQRLVAAVPQLQLQQRRVSDDFADRDRQLAGEGFAAVDRAHEVEILFGVVEAGQIRRQVLNVRIGKIVGGCRHQRRVGAGAAPAFVRLERIHQIFRVLSGNFRVLGERAGPAVAAMATCAERKFGATRIDVGIGGQ